MCVCVCVQGGRFTLDDDAYETRDSVKRQAKATVNQNRRARGTTGGK